LVKLDDAFIVDKADHSFEVVATFSIAITDS